VTETRIRIRANRSTGELEVEGPEPRVLEWWEKLWPDISASARSSRPEPVPQRSVSLPPPSNGDGIPGVFGEFFSEFRSDITDVDKILVAGAFAQGQDAERVFTTKAANQLLLDQNIKVTNASENVRRLTQAKRVFVVSNGKFRVSASGAEYLKTLKSVQ
jgi:hypothetical protein